MTAKWVIRKTGEVDGRPWDLAYPPLVSESGEEVYAATHDAFRTFDHALKWALEDINLARDSGLTPC